MTKYGSFTEEIKCMMTFKLADFIKKQLADLDFTDAKDVLIAVSFINGASNIVNEIIEELDADGNS